MEETLTNINTKAATSMANVKEKISGLLSYLCKGLYEREKPVKMALLSAVAGESIFLLGPPGVGKSLVARRLKYAFDDGKSFEYLMSKFSTPDEIFGPVSIKKLKEEDKYERLTDRYLPGANIVFLDEIWKAGPAIQNALLTILNEKIYRNGDKDEVVDIKGIITASNELPPNNANLAPIWDRFLIRLDMQNIKNYRNFLSMITDTTNVYQDDIPQQYKINEQEWQYWSTEIDKVDLPSEVLNTIQLVKFKIEEYNQQPNTGSNPILIYDRRWKKIVRLLRTAAFLNGRTAVNLMNCFLMIDCLWNHPEHIETIQEMVSETVRKHGYSMAVNLSMLKKEMADFEDEVENEIKIKHTVTEEILLPFKEDYYQLDKKDEKFKGFVVSIKDFVALELNDKKVVNLYDEQLSLVNRLNASKSNQQFAMDIYFNSIKNTYALKTKKGEKTETIYKKPHPIVLKHWQQKHETLKQYLKEQIERLASQQPNQLHDISNNLFVKESLSKIVTANMDEVRTTLQQLQLRLEKLHFSFSE